MEYVLNIGYDNDEKAKLMLFIFQLSFMSFAESIIESFLYALKKYDVEKNKNIHSIIFVSLVFNIYHFFRKKLFTNNIFYSTV